MYELVKKIEPRALLLSLGGISVLLVTVIITLLVVPQYNRYVSANELIALLESSHLKSDQLNKPFIDTKQKTDELQRVLHGEMADLPILQLESFIIGKLQEISWKSQIELGSIRP